MRGFAVTIRFKPTQVQTVNTNLNTSLPSPGCSLLQDTAPALPHDGCLHRTPADIYQLTHTTVHGTVKPILGFGDYKLLHSVENWGEAFKTRILKCMCRVN
jgi:hypothetical protein